MITVTALPTAELTEPILIKPCQKTAILIVRVTDFFEKPVDGITVKLVVKTESGDVEDEGTTAEDGTIAFTIKREAEETITSAELWILEEEKDPWHACDPTIEFDQEKTVHVRLKRRVVLIIGHGSWEEDFGTTAIPRDCTFTIMGPPGSVLDHPTASTLERSVGGFSVAQWVYNTKEAEDLVQILDPKAKLRGEVLGMDIIPLVQTEDYPCTLFDAAHEYSKDKLQVALERKTGCASGFVPNYMLSEDKNPRMFEPGAGMVHPNGTAIKLLKTIGADATLKLTDIFAHSFEDIALGTDYLYMACSASTERTYAVVRQMRDWPGLNMVTTFEDEEEGTEEESYEPIREPIAEGKLTADDGTVLKIITDKTGRGPNSFYECCDYLVPDEKRSGRERLRKFDMLKKEVLPDIEDGKLPSENVFVEMAYCLNNRICIHYVVEGEEEAEPSWYGDEGELRGLIDLLCRYNPEEDESDVFYPLEEDG